MVERCKQCNGILSVGRSATHSLMQTIIEPAAWCKCPEVVHDGNLDSRKVGDHHAMVKIRPYYWGEDKDLVNIDGGHGDVESFSVYIDAQQALSLLEWLQQNKSTLEKIAQEG